MKSSPVVQGTSRIGGATAVGALALAALILAPPLAAIVGHFGVNAGVANTIVGLVVGGAGWALAVFFPLALPYVLTIRGIIAVAGTGAAVGW